MQLSFTISMLIFHVGSTGELGTQSQCDLVLDRFATCITAKNECEKRIKVLEQLTGKGVDDKLPFRIPFRTVKKYLPLQMI